MGKTGSKGMPPEQLTHLVECTHFDKKELNRWYKGFIKDCPDGQLDKKQFIELYSSFYEKGNPAKFAAHVFRTFDVNDDHKIDFREFISALSVTTRGTLEEKLEWCFKVYDIDGNGRISKQEMIHIVTAVQKMAVALDPTKVNNLNIMRVFERMDKDNDGLSLDEFVAGAREDPIFLQMLQVYSM